MTRDPEAQTKPSEEANRGWLVGWASNKGENMNYKYDHIIHLLLNKHGWVRVPWFVSLREMQHARRV